MNKDRFLETIFPALAAWNINKKLCEDQTEKEKNVQKLSQDWGKRISLENIEPVGKMADDLYGFEMQRLNILARKATSILAAAGFVISLSSLTLAVMKDWLNHSWSLFVLFFIILAIIHFVSSAASAAKALEISHFHQLTTGIVDDALKAEKPIDPRSIQLQWTVEKLVDVDMNYQIMLTKTNWLSAAQSLFLRGTYLTGIGFVLLVFMLLS